MKNIGWIFLLVWVSCSTDSEITHEDEAVLSQEERAFMEEYEYVTFNYSPTSFGPDFNEKWKGRVTLFLGGQVPTGYAQSVSQELDILNGLISDGTSLELTPTLTDAQIHLIMGPPEAIREVWPDIYQRIAHGNFHGYALYTSAGGYVIQKGRIWVQNEGIPLFRHELGHVLGLGHASNFYCGTHTGENRSYMCSGLANAYSKFDQGIIRTLYHPLIGTGKTFDEIRPIITELLLGNDISL